jgi:hypothetical protein
MSICIAAELHQHTSIGKTTKQPGRIDSPQSLAKRLESKMTLSPLTASINKLESVLTTQFSLRSIVSCNLTTRRVSQIALKTLSEYCQPIIRQIRSGIQPRWHKSQALAKPFFNTDHAAALQLGWQNWQTTCYKKGE